MNFYNLDIKKVFELTGSSAGGLTSQTASEKLTEFGQNELEVKKKKPAWLIFINQFKATISEKLAPSGTVIGA